MNIILRISSVLAVISFAGWLVALFSTDFTYPNALLYAALVFFVVGYWLAIKNYAAAVGGEWSDN